MLGDLKDKLEPIGRLDVLDGVGARVLDYYQKQDTSEISATAALVQRSRALTPDGAGRQLHAADVDEASTRFTARPWRARPKPSVASPTIRSGCSITRKTSSGWATIARQEA